jgi:DNA-directed RNA polymerase subunit K/omega
MLTSKVLTIQEHQEIIGSRFQLAQLVMARTKQLYNGAPIYKAVGTVGSELNPKFRDEIPLQRYTKIALEEIRLKQFNWKRNTTTLPEAELLSDPNEIVFGS